jgi:hypothetical protein
MGSSKIEVSDDDNLSSKIKARKDCLEKAKKILLTTVTTTTGDCNKCDETSQAFVARLAGLHDSLQDVLSEESLQAGGQSIIPICSSPTQKSPLESMYSQFYSLRWRNRNNRNGTDAMARELFGLEADLYRAMWLACLILLSAINNDNDNNNNISNRNRDRGHSNSRKRSIRELNNNNTDSTGDATRSRNIVLEKTIRQCRLLVRVLEYILENHSATNSQGVECIKNIWDDRILEWTENNSDGDDDDDLLNILSFTKEELEKEEQQLCYMAATPIPRVDTRNPLQKQCLTFNNANSANSSNGDANATNRLLIGRLLREHAITESASSSVSPSVPIELDDRGFLRATTGSSTMDDNDGTVDSGNKNNEQWSLTSQSVVLCDDMESPNKIQINNIISFRTAELTTIALDVGRDSTLWQGHVSRIQANANTTTYGHEQEEMEKLWPVNEVIAAQSKARELFVGEVQKGK